MSRLCHGMKTFFALSCGAVAMVDEYKY
jgi:hypothetical protein